MVSARIKQAREGVSAVQPTAAVCAKRPRRSGVCHQSSRRPEPHACAALRSELRRLTGRYIDRDGKKKNQSLRIVGVRDKPAAMGSALWVRAGEVRALAASGKAARAERTSVDQGQHSFTAPTPSVKDLIAYSLLSVLAGATAPETVICFAALSRKQVAAGSTIYAGRVQRIGHRSRV